MVSFFRVTEKISPVAVDGSSMGEQRIQEISYLMVTVRGD